MVLGVGAQRNTITYNAAISAREKGKQWSRALVLFEKFRGEGVQRYMITYNAAMSACEKGGHRHQALELLERMLGEGCAAKHYH